MKQIARAILIISLSLNGSAPASAVQTDETERLRLLREAAEIEREIVREFGGSAPDYDERFWDMERVPERVDAMYAQRVMQRYQPAIDRVREALAMDGPMYTVDQTAGSDVSYSHLTLIRNAHFLVRRDLIWRAHSGQPADVGKDVLALLALSKQLRNDRFPTSSLSEMANFSMVRGFLRDHAISGGHLSSADAAKIREAMDVKVAADFGMADAWAGERERMVPWMHTLLGEEGGRAQLVESLAGWQLYQGDPTAALKLSSMNDGQVKLAIGLYENALTRIEMIHRIDDLQFAAKEYDRFLEDLRSGEYGVIASLAIPDYNNIDTLKKMIELYEPLREELRVVAESGPAAMLNAAIWYRKAMAKRDLLDAEEWTIVQTVADPDDEMKDGAVPGEIGRAFLDAIVAKAAPIYENLLKAAEIDRCVFETERIAYWFAHRSTYQLAEGLRELSELHLVAAHAALARGEARPAAQHLAATLIMVEHLRQDTDFESAATAETTLTRAMPLLKLILHAAPVAMQTAIDGEISAHTIVAAALDRMNPDDPFGDGAAIAQRPRRTTKPMLEAATRRDEQKSRAEYAKYLHLHIGVSEEDAAALSAELAAIEPHQYAATIEALDQCVRAAASVYAACDTPGAVAEARAAEEALINEPATASVMRWAKLFTDPLDEAALRRTRGHELLEEIRTQLAETVDH